MDNYKWQLQKYSGRNSRHTCPACGRPDCFVFYVDAMGNPLASDVGRCEHRNSCGYEKTPKMFFDEHPQEKERNEYRPVLPQHQKQETKTDYIPFDLIQRSESTGNNLMRYLGKFFPLPDLRRLTKAYHLGSTRKGEIIFPEIDIQGRCRTGKIMQYGEDGHRVKNERDAVDWLHARYMRQQEKKASDFHLKQCLFGEHLLTERPDEIVALTESEKSAIICALVFPDFVWVSCGGKHGLKPDLCKPLAGRNILVYADADAANEWREKIAQLTFCKSIRLSDWSKGEPQGSKQDIADLILEEQKRKQVKPTTVGDVCRWMAELDIPKGRITFNV
ncbi:DUF6371 domain-containing protein [Bacteroides heparinolyticus]|uniref:DUF6371 domain-containing protein n=1 Tax=Prevotella heparinolytica TaxID=28113 RepID=UPI0035A1C8E2